MSVRRIDKWRGKRHPVPTIDEDDLEPEMPLACKLATSLSDTGEWKVYVNPPRRYNFPTLNIKAKKKGKEKVKSIEQAAPPCEVAHS